MKSSTKLAVFAAVLVAVFFGGLALGNAVGPIDVGGTTNHMNHVTPATELTPP